VLTVGGVAATMAWFVRQPYTEADLPLLTQLKDAAKRPGAEVNILGRFLAMLVLVTLPAVLPYVVRLLKETWHGSRARKAIVVTLMLLVLAAVAIHPSLASLPWLPSTWNWQGINGDAPLPGRPIVLTRPIRAAIALAVYFTFCIFAGELTNAKELAGRAWRALCEPRGSSFALVATSLVSIVYSLLVVLRGVEVSIFDRYFLPLLPWAATLMILECGKDERGRSVVTLARSMPYAWALLVVTAIYGILSTQDLWALARARVTAVRRLEAAGVPRTAIDAGFEYNAWTQLLITGYINEWRMRNPPGAYRPQFGQTPEVVPVYTLEYLPTAPDTEATQFGSVPYFSLLPPFHKQVSIDRVLTPPKN
jgi:hypothetical protein